MKASRGWSISVGLLLAATAANAQGTPPQDTGRAGYVPATDLSGPYAEAPPPPPPRVIYGAPDYGNGYGRGYGYGPVLLPPREVYVVLRENGFSPIGVPRLRGVFYSISAIDRAGDDGHLVIDARDGRIVRFVPADRYGGYRDGYGTPPPRPSYGPPEPMTRLDARPQAMPKMASRTPPSVAGPKAAPLKPASEQPAAAKPTLEPVQRSAAVQVKAVETPPAAATPAEAKPAAPVIQPTQPMPKVQDLE